MTRETRQLTKVLVLNDLKNLSLYSNDPRFFRVLGETSKNSEFMYPQLLEKTVFLNPPFIFRFIFSVARVFMSSGFLEKMKVCGGDTKKGDITKCPFALQNLEKEAIPTFLGGKCECKEGCVNGMEN